MEIGHTLKSVAMGMPVLLTGGEPGQRAGEERLSYTKIDAPEVIDLSSRAFAPDSAIPETYSQDGDNISPPIAWTGVPAGTAALALLVEDPDAPTPEPYLHWMVFNIDPQMNHLPEGYMGMGPAIEGKNSTLHMGYVGMAPPRDDLPHRYHFQMYALNRKLDLASGVGRSTLLKAMAGHVIGKGQLIGMYRR